jgi:D-lactate dehydrogenase
MEKTYNIEIYSADPAEQQILDKHFKEHGLNSQINYYQDKISPDFINKNKEAQILSIFVDSVIDSKIMDQFPNLSLIAARSTGFDNIDLVEAKNRNIAVCNVPSYGECTVAEYAFGLILMLSRKIHISTNKFIELGLITNSNIRGFDLNDKTIGVVGTGRIGKKVISIAKGFGMKILAYDANPDKKSASEHGFQYVDLDHLLKHSDVVSLHLPYSKQTHHLINKNTLSQMKKDSILINTSRGAIIDTNDLVQALNNGVIAGAGLDVLEEENIIKDETAFIMSKDRSHHNLCTIVADHALMKMPNVIITPHNAYNTNEALDRILDTTTQNIIAWIQGKPINLVS